MEVFTTSGEQGTESLLIAGDLLAQTTADLHALLPEEGVGLWSGCGHEVRTWTPLRNVAAHRRVRYDVHPQEWIDALHQTELRGEVPLALVHSHPTSPAVPSAYDRVHWHYPDLWCVIVSFAGDIPVWNAYPACK